MTYGRRRGHRDANHKPIVDALQGLGCSVLDLSALGDGAPDILVAGGPVGDPVVAEIKNPENTGGTRGLKTHQRDWLASWPSRTVVLWSVEDAIAWATGARRPEPPKWAQRIYTPTDDQKPARKRRSSRGSIYPTGECGRAS